MIFGGIFIVAIAPRDPWSVGMFIYLYLCSIIGCIIGILISDSHYKAFIISIILSMIILISGVIIADIYIEGHKVISEYIMWFPIMMVCIGMNTFGGTLSVFPFVNSTINWVRKKKRA